MLSLRKLSLATLLTLSMILAGTTTASASWPPVEVCPGGVCIEVTDPGTGPINNDLNAGPISIPTTPGPTVCTHPDDAEAEIPCETDRGWWNAERRCYVKLDDPQPAPPDGSSGAYYRCSHIGPLDEDGLLTNFTTTYRYFSETPPPGVNRLSPWQVARVLVSSFQLEPIGIGMAPRDGAKTYVGYQIWMWAADPQPLSYGPYTESLSLGGQTITATARVATVSWNMGDGNSVLCNAGTAYNPDVHGGSASPTCGYQYTTASPEGEPYTITATSTWAVTWSGGGESGTLYLSRTATRTVEVGQLQAVNVPNP